MMVRAGLVQITSGDDPAANLPVTLGLIRDAAASGASFVLTPEVTNCVSNSRSHQRAVLQTEADDITLAALRDEAAKLGITLLIGSLGLEDQGPDARFANRSFLIGPDGGIVARYDKLHMFDVNVSAEETYRESDGYAPGDAAVVADAGFAKIGMSVCYDLRFAYLYRALAKAGAQILTVPAAFSYLTGQAHWHVLLRARAIETGCFVLAPAQCGTHPSQKGASRKTYGHSLAVAPWGEVLADADDLPGVQMVDLDLEDVTRARHKVPALTHDRSFSGP